MTEQELQAIEARLAACRPGVDALLGDGPPLLPAIVLSWTDVPALVAEVRRLRGPLDQVSREAADERRCRVANQDALRVLGAV